MSIERDVENIWSSHWHANAPEATWPVRDRFAQEAFKKIERYIRESDRHILEAGCGTGRFCVMVGKAHPSAAVIGVDISASALEIARRLSTAMHSANVSFSEGSLFQLPFANNEFDVCLSEGVLCLFEPTAKPNYVDALNELVRVVRPGGTVLIALPNWHCYTHVLYKRVLRALGRPYEYGYEKSFTGHELQQLFRNAGLRVTDFTGYYPSYGFYRLENRVRRRRLKRLFNIMGRLVDRFDCETISRRFGFQILAVGQKL